jgi:hypothetical protein
VTTVSFKNNKKKMLARFGLIFVILLFVTVNGGSNSNGQCCTGYLREYDHVEACYWFQGGKCCADNVIYSKKHGQLIGTEDARIITEDTSGLCRQCFDEIVEC